MYKAAFVGVSVTAMAYMSKTRFSSMFNQISDCDEGKDPRRKPLSRKDDPFFRSKKKRPLNELDLKIFAGSASKELASEIADHLGMSISSCDTGQFADKETYVRVNETVRGKHCYIIQSTCPPANDNLMELFLMISTLKRASAKSITTVIPYYGYARQDRKSEDRVSIGAADVARLLETMGVD
jgi:ribose-phosphate pyrophosphokinase